MLDRRLGMVNWLIRAIVLVWIIGYVFIWRQGYCETEKSVGHAISSVNGTTFSTVNDVSRPWDFIDAVQPALENGAAFVSTTVFETAGQIVQTGSDPSQPCTSDSKCPNNPPLSLGQCVSALCQTLAWHPAFTETDSEHTTKYQLASADQFGFWLKASVMFADLDPTSIFSTIGSATTTPYDTWIASNTPSVVTEDSTTLGDSTSPAPDYFTLSELLYLAGSDFDEAKDRGCTLSIVFHWTCRVDGTTDCHPQIQVSRMDLNPRRQGFEYQYANYYRPTEGGVSTRDLYTVRGVRLLISSLGTGKRVSISAIMLQISSGIALLWLANFAADFIMLQVLPERKHYRTYKQERTPDFSDLRNKIAEVEGEKKKLRDRKNRFAAKLDEN